MNNAINTLKKIQKQLKANGIKSRLVTKFATLHTEILSYGSNETGMTLSEQFKADAKITEDRIFEIWDQVTAIANAEGFKLGGYEYDRKNDFGGNDITESIYLRD
tara:strand:+ start:182 stop:496 length:315 start_codon:yes stop_codon:yes gene_type:complete